MQQIDYIFKCDNKTVSTAKINNSALITYISLITKSYKLITESIQIQLAIPCNEQENWQNIINKYALLECNITNLKKDNHNIELFNGIIDTIKVKHNGPQNLLKITIISPIITLNKTITRYYSSEEQKKRNPNDSSLDFYYKIRYQESLWGQYKIDNDEEDK